MNVNGRRTSRKIVPEMSTTIEKSFPQVRFKEDVPKSECGHHRERPVEARNPAEVPSFTLHDEVEDDRIDGNHHRQHKKEPQQNA